MLYILQVLAIYFRKYEKISHHQGFFFHNMSLSTQLCEDELWQ